MRVIGGKFKGTPLKVYSNIRPTSFRIRKGIFDLIREVIDGCVVLDLFAGSGALGIEALSWGAKEVVFVDIHKGCIRTVRHNISRLNILSFSQLLLKDSFKAIRDFKAKDIKFDIIFVDPPYYKDMAKKALQTLDAYDILAPSGYIVVLSYQHEMVGNYYHNFKILVVKNYGQSRLCIYKKGPFS